MDQSPLVTIIIPTYNNKDVVCDAIDCSLKQTYERLEVIVVDDGSADGTGALLIEKYGCSINYIRQENRGLSAARNTGIRNASGKYYQFLDADDLIDHNKIRIQMEQLQGIPGLAVAYCDYIRSAIDDEKVIFKRKTPLLDRQKPFDDLIMKWETAVSIPPHCFLFDAAFFNTQGISFDESLPTHEDWDCWMSVFACKPHVTFIDRPLANYRVRSDSMCSNREKMRKGFLMAIDRQISKNRGDDDAVAKLKMRRKEIRHLYQDVSPVMRIMDRCHPLLKNMYMETIPWRIRLLLD